MSTRVIAVENGTSKTLDQGYTDVRGSVTLSVFLGDDMATVVGRVPDQITLNIHDWDEDTTRGQQLSLDVDAARLVRDLLTELIDRADELTDVDVCAYCGHTLHPDYEVLAAADGGPESLPVSMQTGSVACGSNPHREPRIGGRAGRHQPVPSPARARAELAEVAE